MVKTNLPVLLIKDMVLFPSNELRLEFSDLTQKQLLSLTESYYDNHLLVVTPLDILEINPDITELPKIGVIANIKMKMDMPNGKTRVVLEGIKRVSVLSYTKDDDFYEAIIGSQDVPILEPKEELAYVRSLVKQLEIYVNQIPYMSNAVLSQISGVTSLAKVTDIVASFFPSSIPRKLELLEENNPTERVKMLIDDMNQDIQVLELEKRIEEEVNHRLEEGQKEYVLREKMNVIRQELGETNDTNIEIDLLKEKAKRLKCSPTIRARIIEEINRYRINPNSPEMGSVRHYIDWMLSLPWCNYTKDVNDLNKVKAVLDSTHYGLEAVKLRILEYLAVKQKTNQVKTPVICLVGPPGVGKTSLAKSIAKSLGRKVAKISVGGINDEAEIIGHRRTYIGAAPGRIIQEIKKAGTTNPVFIIDEIDKMTKDIKGDPASSLLEVLDPEQNSHFSDHYIEENFDLSKVLFVATANYIDQIPPELQDRLEVIELSSYTEYEKLDIAKSYIIPKLLEEHGLTEIEVQLDDSAILSIIRHYTREAGVRDLERVIASLFRKVAKKLLSEKEIASYQITDKNISSFLGRKKNYNYLYKEKQVGIVNALAYTPYGGEVLQVEATCYQGRGNLLLTGSLGEIMKESAQIALSYVKTYSTDLGIEKKQLDKLDTHIHIPLNQIPKEGPSAGAAITLTLISLFTNRAVSHRIALTGEVTLRGRILPVGGIKEKLLGAIRNGIKTIYLPNGNKRDLEEIPKEILNQIEIIFVNHMNELISYVFF